MPPNGPSSLATRLAGRDLLVLDGATGTELERRGAAAALPLWSARALIEAPELVAAIHRDYVDAGADVITANTFRTQRRTLERGGAGERAEELTRSAVEIARRAAREGATDREVFVVGSVPPLEDCFRPDLVPTEHELAREHAEHAEHLAAAGVDGILIETMNTGREALAALRAARATGLPSLVSFVCWEGAQLLSDESLQSTLDRIASARPDAVLVNACPRRTPQPASRSCENRSDRSASIPISEFRRPPATTASHSIRPNSQSVYQPGATPARAYSAGVAGRPPPTRSPLRNGCASDWKARARFVLRDTNCVHRSSAVACRLPVLRSCVTKNTVHPVTYENPPRSTQLARDLLLHRAVRATA